MAKSKFDRRFLGSAFAIEWLHILIMALLITGSTFLAYLVEKSTPFSFPFATNVISTYATIMVFLLTTRIIAEKALYDAAVRTFVEFIGTTATLRSFLLRRGANNQYVVLCNKIIDTVALDHWIDVEQDDVDDLSIEFGPELVSTGKKTRDLIEELIEKVDDFALNDQTETAIQTYLRSLEIMGSQLDLLTFNIAASSSKVISDVAIISLRIYGLALPWFYWGLYRWYTIPAAIFLYVFFAAFEGIANIFSLPQRSFESNYAYADVRSYATRNIAEFEEGEEKKQR